MSVRFRHRRSRARFIARPPIRSARSEKLENRTLLSVFTVTSAADSGAGSLRQAIANANAHSGADTIQFNIAGAGAQTIYPLTQLPDITGPTTVDGTAQHGYSGTPLIILNGAPSKIDTGLRLVGLNCVVRGLRVDGFNRTGIEGDANLLVQNNVIVRNQVFGIYFRNGNSTAQGNFIGTDAAGTSGLGNGEGIITDTLIGNILIGGTTPAQRNVISGNHEDGVHIFSKDSVIEGNYIGITPAGNAPLANLIGIEARDADNLTIGGTTPGAVNVISGNRYDNVRYGLNDFSPFSAGVIEGNLIGTDASGTKNVDPTTSAAGILVSNCEGLTIGGTVAGARNIISANNYGIQISFAGATGIKVQGNYIGTDITGTKPLGNNTVGIDIDSKAGKNLIGGTTATARNIISGSGTTFGFGYGIWLDDDGANGAKAGGNLIEGNYIGTDVTGTKAIPNKEGVHIYQNANNIIGGTTLAAANLISGNSGAGVVIDSRFDFDETANNLVEGNFIGTSVDHLTALGNGGPGVQALYAASGAYFRNDNTIGGAAKGAGNVIAFNKGAGVSILSARRVGIRHNSIYSNGGVGIDLKADGVTANDAGDLDAGPNDLLNYPVLAKATSITGTTTITGTLNTLPSSKCTIEFFASASADPSGYGEGQRYLGSTTITTDASGKGAFTASLPVTVLNGQAITATTTDAAGNTSEFSKAIKCAGVAAALISGSVFNDANANAKRDAGEPGLSNVRVYIDANNNGTLDAGELSVLSDSNGNWSFKNLLPGSYIVRVVAQSGLKLTTASPLTVTLAAGETLTGKLFGEKKTV